MGIAIRQVLVLQGVHNDSKAVWSLYGQHNIKIETQVRPGNHEWRVWRPALHDFATKIF